MTGRLTRSDTRDNRGRILGAARALVAAGGPGVPVREIARHAGVAPATVYRHFPTKQTLLASAFLDQSRAWRAVLHGGLADPDPGRGLRHAVRRLCELQVRDQGFTAAVKSAFPHAVDFAGLRAASLMSAAALVDRAKGAGHLRADIGLNDLLLMLTAAGGLRATSPAARAASAGRYAELTMRALQPDAGPGPAAKAASR